MSKYHAINAQGQPGLSPRRFNPRYPTDMNVGGSQMKSGVGKKKSYGYCGQNPSQVQ